MALQRRRPRREPGPAHGAVWGPQQAKVPRPKGRRLRRNCSTRPQTGNDLGNTGTKYLEASRTWCC
eukprot:15468501-Alexandrium_andersonii.AAC.1